MQLWDTIIERKGTHTIKWDAMEPFVGKAELLPFWVADMDFESPKAVSEALETRAKHGVFGYTYECAKQSLAVSAAESAAKEKASHHPYTVDLRAWE